MRSRFVRNALVATALAAVAAIGRLAGSTEPSHSPLLKSEVPTTARAGSEYPPVAKTVRTSHVYASPFLPLR